MLSGICQLIQLEADTLGVECFMKVDSTTLPHGVVTRNHVNS